MTEGISRIGTWAVLLPTARYEAERLFHHETLELTGFEDGASRPVPGDQVLVVVEAEDSKSPLVVALGRVAGSPGVETDPDDPQSGQLEPLPLVVTYTHRAFDEPVPADQLVLTGPATLIDTATYRELANRIGPAPDRRGWLVSLDLPIEASSPAEAVRIFWSYVMELGPRELPTFVSPVGNELAMQAFVLGVEANQDPEEDD
ncbi:hypothetical protein GCM10027290_22260 [Micromonospora sonneratiae]|uniref:Uncharacterized protein n=1 Tax=Micromonospora sonneratiae TaxID=1184706 RepID=A0ABW3YD93_9ACTN